MQKSKGAWKPVNKLTLQYQNTRFHLTANFDINNCFEHISIYILIDEYIYIYIYIIPTWNNIFLHIFSTLLFGSTCLTLRIGEVIMSGFLSVMSKPTYSL